MKYLYSSKYFIEIKSCILYFEKKTGHFVPPDAYVIGFLKLLNGAFLEKQSVVLFPGTLDELAGLHIIVGGGVQQTRDVGVCRSPTPGWLLILVVLGYVYSSDWDAHAFLRES